MAKHPKTRRTQLNDLSAGEQELSQQAARRVRGGIAVSDPGPDDPPPKPLAKPKGSK